MWNPRAFLTCLLASSHAAAQFFPSQSYVTESFTPPDMEITQTGPTAPGYLFLSLSGNGTKSPSPLIFTNNNELIWSGPADGWTYTDFHVQTLNGQPCITVIRSNSSATYGNAYGAVEIWDGAYRNIHTVCPQGLGIVTPGNIVYECYLDQHEALITSQGTLLATAYNVTQADLTSVGGPSDGWVFDSIFYEIDIATGEVLFRWRSRDYPDQIPITDSQYPLNANGLHYGSSQTQPWDYFHINSVQKLSDGYLVNSRHLFSTFKVYFNRSIEWRLSGLNGGDFTLAPDVYFSWQHRPRVLPYSSSSHILIEYFNNDNSEVQTGVNATTALLLNVYPNNRSVTVAKKLSVPSEPIFANSQGSYVTLGNSGGLVGYGQIAKTREFDARNNLVFEATYGYSNASSRTASYRSYRDQWVGRPATPPKAVVKNNTFYVSWNGATEVQSWRLSTGSSCTTLRPSKKAQSKTGFESAYSLNGLNGAYVQAQALDRRGRALGNTGCLAIA